MSDQADIKVAAIQYEAQRGDEIDAMLRACAETLKGEGYRLAGAVQINAERVGFSRCDMLIEDLASGKKTDTTDQTRAERGCRLDATALEDAAGLAQQSITEATDLVIINRFGKQEALGQGFRSAMEAAAMHDVPLLTSFSPSNRAAFEAFSSGTAAILPADGDAIMAWCRSVLKARTAA